LDACSLCPPPTIDTLRCTGENANYIKEGEVDLVSIVSMVPIATHSFALQKQDEKKREKSF
jgi:hypothetical protein